VILPIDLTINTSDPIIKNSIGYNFGSKYIQGASSMVLNNRARSYKEAACKILVFDALIENVDRRENNPNLLNHDRTLYAIDHELAFSFIRAIGPRDYTFLREHALRDLAKGAESLIDAICEDLSDLYTWDSLNILADRIPEEWKKDQEPVVDEIIKHIDDVCKNSAQLSNYIKEVLR
jgi:hypothetical protein